MTDTQPTLFEAFTNNASLQADILELVAKLETTTLESISDVLNLLVRVEAEVREISHEAFIDFGALTGVENGAPANVAKGLKEALHLQV